MKALVLPKYGSTENLRIEEVPEPEMKPNEVLVSVRCTAVNDYDWVTVLGSPILYRLLFGLFKPKNAILGMEFSGVVEALGSDTTKLKVGDRVYGDTSDSKFGTYAEYISLPEDSMIKMADGMRFEEAVTIPHASMLAIQGLRDIGKIGKGQNVLINGAGGGVGTYALQFAKRFDAEVTGVDGSHKHKSMLGLGYDHVIDYKTTDFTRTGKRYDLILDAKSNRGPGAYLRALKPGGTFVTVGGTLTRLMGLALSIPIVNRLSNKKLRILGLKPNKGLELMNELYAEGGMEFNIDGPYPLEKAPWAIQRFGDAMHNGKVVIRVSQETE